MDDVVSGTLKYVTGYTGFSGDASEQSGNYLALAVTRKEGVTVTLDMIGGDHEGHPATFPDEDEICVVRVKNTAQKLVFTAYLDDVAVETRVIQLTGLTLTPSA